MLRDNRAVLLVIVLIAVVSGLANEIFNLNIPVERIFTIAWLVIGLGALIVSALLLGNKLRPSDGWGQTPLGMLFIGIGCLSLGTRYGLIVRYGDDLSQGLSRTLAVLSVLFIVGLVIESKGNKEDPGLT
ncbi:MAG: hypothetical protein QGI83_19945 [Candidatus Latescibacteria bacterium]|nr:hypothetical protein [Candidatus Latescibacterota bacterium]